MANPYAQIDNTQKVQPSPLRSGLASAFGRERKYNIVIFASLFLWFLAVQILYLLIDGPGVTIQKSASNFVSKMVFYGTIYLSIWAVFSLVKFAISLGEKSAAQAIQQAYQKDPSLPIAWLIRIFLAVLSYVLLMTNFMSVKTLIPEIVPFYLDTAAHKLDRLLFLGHDPWTLFSWMYDYPKAIVTIDRLYTIWIGLIVGTWIYCFTSQAAPLRQRYQYIFSMVLLWFLAGNILAILLSSAGPIYFEYFTGSDAYQPLTLSLAAIHETENLGAYEYSEMLLRMYENQESRFAGISALPSLHCGSSLMMLLLFWKSKSLRALLIAFNIIIFIGSIVLAWHYALDGLIAYPIALLCWWLGGKLTHSFGKKQPV